MLRVFLFCLILGLIALSGAGIAYRHAISTPLSLTDHSSVVEVEPGDSLSRVLTKLSDLGAIESQWPAKVYARLKGIDANIKTGEVLLVSGMRIPDLFEALLSNDRVQYSVTLVEGQTVSEVINALTKDSRLNSSIQTKSEQDWADLSAPYGNIEGLLFPDTYYFKKGDSDWDIVLRARRAMDVQLESSWNNRAEDLPYKNQYEALIMASIIEKETGVPAERPDIAGVFVRRLNKGMRLQTDPTVIYGLGEAYQGNITRAHLRQATPYNTYVIRGLPPTPIALAGKAAIDAALNPAAGKTYYFVAKGDGSHYFSQTLAEHQRAVQQYQIKQRSSNYRSRPDVTQQ